MFGSPFEIQYIDEIESYDGGSSNNYEIIKQVSAFTVAELGGMLPDYTLTEERKGKWTCEWKNVEFAGSEADARARMLIYLIEHGLVPTETLSKDR